MVNDTDVRIIFLFGSFWIHHHSSVYNQPTNAHTYNRTSSCFVCYEGETWNLMKVGYQLKQVRERIAKGLVVKQNKRKSYTHTLPTPPTHSRTRASCEQKNATLFSLTWPPTPLQIKPSRINSSNASLTHF